MLLWWQKMRANINIVQTVTFRQAQAAKSSQFSISNFQKLFWWKFFSRNPIVLWRQWGSGEATRGRSLGKHTSISGQTTTLSSFIWISFKLWFLIFLNPLLVVGKVTPFVVKQQLCPALQIFPSWFFPSVQILKWHQVSSQFLQDGNFCLFMSYFFQKVEVSCRN